MSGPKRRFLERQATYQVAISNTGTVAAQRVELVAYLPAGLKFVSANNSGQYDEARRAVRWLLEELPTNEKGVVELVTLPIEPGQQSIKLRGTAAKAEAVERRAAGRGRRPRGRALPIGAEQQSDRNRRADGL